MTERKILTTTGGNPVSDNQNSMTAGDRGPVLMQVYQLIEKLAHQNRERIPERVIHAKGSAAFGKLTITGDISKYTKAKIFQSGAITRSLLRFSTVAGERGAADAERYRVGTNYEALPVNRPTSEVNNYIRDGSMRFDGNGGDAVNYEPNSFNGPAEAPGKEVSGFDLGHVAADRFNHRDGNDDYTQPGDLFRLLDNDQQGRLMDNIAEAMDGVPKDIVTRQVEHFYKADPDYGIGVATRMGLTPADIPCAQAAE